jgi:hypothetical protein
MYAEAIPLTGPDIGQIAMPTEPGHLRQVDARLVAVVVEQTEFDPFSHL